MTDWVIVLSNIKPADLDTTSSDKFVYQRRNFQRVSFIDVSRDVTCEMWQYDERKMSHGEYEKLLEISIAENSAAIDDIIISLLEG